MEFLTENQEWVEFYPNFNSSFYLEKAGYFDERPCIVTSVTQLGVLIVLPFLLLTSLWYILLTPLLLFGWGKLFIKLPIRTGIQDCESAAWGFNYHDNTIWVYIGGAGNFDGGRKWVTIRMPWYYTWVRTSTLMKSGYDWFHETETNRVSWETDVNGETLGSYEWLKKHKHTETYNFIDKFDGTIVKATISVVEREWRPIWFKWVKLFAKVIRTIDVTFDQEVGKRKRSWKGGVIGCGYDLKSGETPYECLMRMQSECEF